MTASREQALGEANRVWGTELAIYVEPPDADPHARSCGRAPEQSEPLSRYGLFCHRSRGKLHLLIRKRSIQERHGKLLFLDATSFITGTYPRMTRYKVWQVEK